MVISVFFLVLVAAFAAVAYFTEPSKADKLIHARMTALDRNVAVTSEDPEADIVKEISFSNVAMFDDLLRRNRFAVGLHLLIEQADLEWTVGRFVFTTLAAVVVGAALGNWWISPTWTGWLPGIALGAAPYGFLYSKRAWRFRRFSTLLPAAIDLMSRSLRAGQALPATLEIVAQEMEEPVGSEFKRAADEQAFGLPFREAMLNLARRIPISDLQILVTAILVQKESGGNLVLILEKTAYVIRERIRVEGQLRIRTAQGRLTGWVLCGLPIAMFLLMNVVSPGYGRILFESPTGQKWVEYAATLMVIGVFVIRRIVAVKF